MRITKGALYAIGLAAFLGAGAAWAQDMPAPTISTPTAAPADAPPLETAPPPAENPVTGPAPATEYPAPEPAPVAEARSPDAAPTATESSDQATMESADQPSTGNVDHAAAEGADHATPAGAVAGAIGGGFHHAHSGPTAYNRIKVDSADDLTFYYIRQDLFLALGETDAARYSALVAAGAYGPYSTGSEIQVRAAAPYILLPRCDGQPLGAHQRIVQSNYGAAVTTKVITCH